MSKMQAFVGGILAVMGIIATLAVSGWVRKVFESLTTVGIRSAGRTRRRTVKQAA
ncbi:MAG: hypothetical protein HZB35_00970 [Nitrospirae bacterium]|nr:hypothetical protein [Nitrospirota bacterium]